MSSLVIVVVVDFCLGFVFGTVGWLVGCFWRNGVEWWNFWTRIAEGVGFKCLFKVARSRATNDVSRRRARANAALQMRVRGGRGRGGQRLLVGERWAASSVGDTLGEDVKALTQARPHVVSHQRSGELAVVASSIPINAMRKITSWWLADDTNQQEKYARE